MTGPLDGDGNIDLPSGGPARRDLDVHASELKLRRFLAGENLAAQPIDVPAHVADCVDCARRLDALREEQRSFEDRISFDRFAAGVERAARVPGHSPTPTPEPRRWTSRWASRRSFVTMISVGSLAAAFALLVGSRSMLQSDHVTEADPAGDASRAKQRNRTKGGGGGRAPAAAILVQVADGGDPNRQRTVGSDAPAVLGGTDRIRIGVQAGPFSFLFAISIDDQGVVTALYPDAGSSMPLGPAAGVMQVLPDSLELTGQGAERLVVVLTDQALPEIRVRDAASAAFHEAGGDLRRLTKLALPGEQFHRLFIKP